MVLKLRELISLAKEKGKKRLVVAAAEDLIVIKAVKDAVDLEIIEGILIGNSHKIKEICEEESIDINKFTIIHEENTEEAAKKSVAFIRDGKADFIMKGLLNTSKLLKAVLNKEGGIKISETLSHVMVYETNYYHKLFIVTDGGMILKPDLKDKISIIKNSLKVTDALNIINPKVAVLGAVEQVNSIMEATIDAASLSMMNKRGQISNCIVDGPLALDNAICKEAAEHKGIKSEVAGDADILLVPNIEAGNFLGKSITYFGGGESAGIIIGAKCPIILVSRADSTKSKLYSIALGAVI